MNLAARGLKVREEAQKLFDYPDAALDFDGDPHERVRMGAYSIGKSRPRWFPALEMKPFPHESLRLDHGTAPASSMNKDNR
jgi:hypothetical protein